MVPRVQSRGTLSHNVLAEQAYRLPASSIGRPHRPANPSRQPTLRQQAHALLDRIRRQHRNHANAHIEGRLHVSLAYLAELLKKPKDREWLPTRTVDPDFACSGHDSGQVVGEAATGDVTQRMHLDGF